MAVQNLSVISVNLWQILISLANLSIMYVILKKFMFKPVQKILATRKSQVDSLYKDAEADKAAAAQSKAQYEASLAGARSEADRIVSDARKSAKLHEEKEKAQTAEDISRMKQKAEEEIAQEKRQMMQDAREEISDLAIDIASKVVGREINQQDHTDMLDDFIRNVGEDR